MSSCLRSRPSARPVAPSSAISTLCPSILEVGPETVREIAVVLDDQDSGHDASMTRSAPPVATMSATTGSGQFDDESGAALTLRPRHSSGPRARPPVARTTANPMPLPGTPSARRSRTKGFQIRSRSARRDPGPAVLDLDSRVRLT